MSRPMFPVWPILRGRALPLIFLAAWMGLRGTTAAATPTVWIDDARMKEGDSGPRTMMFTVRLSAPASSPVAVQVETVDGTAKVSDLDYEGFDGQLIFPPLSTAESLGVVVLGDTKLEGNEWFVVRLSNPEGAVFGDNQAIGMILNDERARFQKVIAHVPIYPYGTVPNGWGDCDGDGYPDLPLYHSNGDGTLTEIPGFRQLLAFGNYHGVAWCDYDRDGDLDLALLGYSGVDGGTATPTRLLRNDGEAGFVDMAALSGMNIIASGETTVWGDFDADGWPDLFAPYYSFIYPFQSFLYHNNGDGTFTDRAAAAGVDLAYIPVDLRPEGAQAADWNDDGHLDLYCASHLFINDGSGHFTDVREAVGLPILFDEGAALVDYDNDGDLDLYLRANDGAHLFRNDAGHFEAVPDAAGLQPIGYLWGDSWADADGDGDLDLLMIPPDEHARLMLNRGDGTFERDTLFDLLEVPGELSAWGDCDRDGDLDFVVGSGYTRQVCLNRQQQPGHYDGSHMTVWILDAEGHQTMYGATVRLKQIGGPPGTTQTRVVDGGSGYLSQNDYPVHFGGVGSGTYALEVVFPSPAGTRVVVDSLTNPLLGRIEPGTAAQYTYTIFRDGRVKFISEPAEPVAGVGEVARGITRTRLLGVPSPSPAIRRVTIPLTRQDAEPMTLSIHDLRGRLVRRLDPSARSAGGTAIDWDLRDDRGSPVATGVYFCRLLVDGRPADVRRVLVMR